MPGLALTLFTVRGIPLRLHISLLLVVPFLAITFATRDLPRLLHRAGLDPGALTLGPAALGLLLALAVFAAVALHELGHALTARAQGARVSGVTLMILGGVTEVEHEEATPKQEFWMAFAGPLVNLALAALAWALLRVPSLPLDLSVGLQVMVVVNLFLALFNLVPAFPLDGGRMLRAGLRLRFERVRATRMAADLGRLLGGAAVVFGLFSGAIMLAVVGVVVFMGASQERAQVALPGRLTGLMARQAMHDRLVTVYPTTSVVGVARHLLLRGAEAAVVSEPGNILGVLRVEDLRRARPTATAGEVVRGPVLRVTADADLAEVLLAMRAHRQPALVFDDANAVVGLVTPETLDRAADLRRLTEGLRAADDRAAEAGGQRD